MRVRMVGGRLRRNCSSWNGRFVGGAREALDTHSRFSKPFNAVEATLPPAVRVNVDAAYGRDQPLLVQYGRYLAGLAQGDLGPSLRFKDFRVGESLVTVQTTGRPAEDGQLVIEIPPGSTRAYPRQEPLDG